ncbi:Druantia anti-phage system protein DruA [Desulfolutivibrio sp.]|uniref:Druantia anti-phage system protein DruA n=1 Tax=Desulfolutivibrio sp. TaxID=2773296 RepID=UPI002F964759
MSGQGNNSTKVIRVATREASLRSKIRRHLRELGFHKTKEGNLEISGSGKDVIRTLHSSQRNERLAANADFFARRTPKLLHHFASGNDINPAAITPMLERIHADTWQADLFRLASLTWSVPVSNGFGRRLRYLVWDAHNEKLIGLIAIGDPVFNLSVRDNLIGWNVHERVARLVNIMDAYVLGALPPYSALLGGKMVACLVRSREIYDDFARTYGGTVGIISGEEKKARLLAVTTASSMGRSSVYNRLKLGGIPYFTSIGYTGGWGHFHIPDKLFLELRDYLRSIGHRYADLHQFGQGPNWRLRTTRAALTALGFRDDLLRHGIQREVFICNLAANATKILRTGKGDPDVSSLLSAREIAELAVERWILPRSQRRPEYRLWTNDDLLHLFEKHSWIKKDQLASKAI